MNIKKGDKVIVTKGKDAGKTGAILRAFPKTNMVLVDGLNMKKHHVKPTRTEKGKTVAVSHPINRSNVALVDAKKA